MEHVAVADLEIGFRRSGGGPPLLFLHGALSDSRVWGPVLGQLSDEYTVIAWDAPGCGRSSDPPEHFRMGDFAECLAEVVDALGSERLHVVGHSWGSTLALELCLRRPAQVRSLVLVGAYAGWAGSLPPEEVRRRLEAAVDAADAIATNEWDPRSMPGLFSEHMPRAHAELLVTVMSEARPAATRTMARALAEADLRSALPRVEAPTLILSGAADERAPLGVARALDHAIRDSTLTVLPGLGHECFLEAPATFSAAVRAFLGAL